MVGRRVCGRYLSRPSSALGIWHGQRRGWQYSVVCSRSIRQWQREELGTTTVPLFLRRSIYLATGSLKSLVAQAVSVAEGRNRPSASVDSVLASLTAALYGRRMR